jgi:hypothetical protein
MTKFQRRSYLIFGVFFLVASFAYEHLPLAIHGNLTNGESSIICLIYGVYCFLSVQIGTAKVPKKETTWK